MAEVLPVSRGPIIRQIIISVYAEGPAGEHLEVAATEGYTVGKAQDDLQRAMKFLVEMRAGKGHPTFPVH